MRIESKQYQGRVDINMKESVVEFCTSIKIRCF
jgi:hypothetical protein